MRKLLALLLIASTPVAGVAQTLAPVSPILAQVPGSQPLLLEQILSQNKLFSSVDTHSVPLWSTPDGHILAMLVSTGDNYPALPVSPQIGTPNEWRLVDVTNIVSGGLQLRLNDSSAAHLSLTRSSVLAPPAATNGLLCGPSLSTNMPCFNSNEIAHGGELRLGADWLATDNIQVDLSYGLSWLRHNNLAPGVQPAAGYDALANIGDAGLPTLVMPGNEANVQNSSISALGRLRLNDNQALDLGATLSRIQLSIPGAAPLTSLNQAALSFGVEYGSFTGTLTGRVLGPTESLGSPGLSNQHFAGLDVGISWHTPWRGMFSVGAQNLWSSGSLPYLNEPATRELDANQARVPYVQYHQDL